MSRPPAASMRLFEGYDAAQLEQPGHRDFLIGRLLEEGDSADLAWLAGRVGRVELAEWVARRGDRQLSRRSRLFWRRLLPGPAAPADDAQARQAREALWPL